MDKALEALGSDVFEDTEGRKHPWGAEITQALAERQNDDGSWTNKNSRWLESDANLVTGYALLTLSHARGAR